MPWKLTNVALDPTYAQKRRMATAARLEMEPVIAGNRLRLRQVVTISDRLYEANKTRIDLFEKMGVLTAEEQGGAKKVEAPKPPAYKEPEPLPEPKIELPKPDPGPVTLEWEESPAEPDTEPATPKTKKSKKGKNQK